MFGRKALKREIRDLRDIIHNLRDKREVLSGVVQSSLVLAVKEHVGDLKFAEEFCTNPGSWGVVYSTEAIIKKAAELLSGAILIRVKTETTKIKRKVSVTGTGTEPKKVYI